MRAALIISFAANVVLVLVSFAILPAKVAVHFGPGGMPNNWASKEVNALIFLGLDVVVFLSLYFSPRLTFLYPAKWINLPNKQFWLAPENLRRTTAKVSALMDQLGVALFLFLLVITLLTLQANLADPVKLNERPFFICLAILLVYTVGWSIGFFRSFRVPIGSLVANPGRENIARKP